MTTTNGRGAPEPRDGGGGLHWLIVAAVVAMIARIPALERRGFWQDEYYTLGAVRLTIPDMMAERLSSGHSPFYFLFARLGLWLGDAEWQLRLTSLLACGAAVLGVGLLARALQLPRVALGTCLAVAIAQPYWVTIATEFRYMMFQVALTAFVLAAAVHRCRFPRCLRTAMRLFIACMPLAWTHGSTQLVLLAIAGGLLVEWRLRDGCWNTRVLVSAWPVLAGMASSLPLAFLVTNRGDSRAPSLPDFDLVLRNSMHVVFGDQDYWMIPLGLPGGVLVAMFLIATVALVAACIRRLEWTPGWGFLAATTLLIPYTILFTAGLGAGAQGPTRYMASASVPAIIWIGCGAVACWRLGGWWRLPAGFTAAAFALQFVGATLDLGDLQREGVRHVLAHRTAGDRIVVCTGAINALALEYHGLPDRDSLVALPPRGVQLPGMRWLLRRALGDADRAWILLYRHERVPVEEALSQLGEEGFLVRQRRWELGARVRVIAVARTAAGAEWVDALPEPALPFGLLADND